MPAGWHRTAAWYRLIGVAVFALGLGVAVGRADLVVLGAPFVLLLVLALLGTQPTGSEPHATAALTAEPAQGRRADVAVTLTGTTGAQLTLVSMPPADPRLPGRVAGVPGTDTVLAGPSSPLTWGRVVVARPDVAIVGPDGLWRTDPVRSGELAANVAPEVIRVPGLELPPIFGGWSGEHRSRRPGQGTELIDLRQYAPGDRLRSIHWRAYARHQQLYVRRTESSADAEFALCLDTRHDIGPDRAQPRSRTALGRSARTMARWLESSLSWTRTVLSIGAAPPPAPLSSLDLLVAAATGIAAAQLRLGDRVGVLDLAAPGRHLQLGTGVRHLQRIRQQLAQLIPSNRAFALQPDHWRLPATAVVVYCSALIDDVAVQAALDVRARGHQIQVVDVLPVLALRSAAAQAPLGPGERAARNVRVAALDIMLAERDVRVDRLRAVGVPVLRWENGQLPTDVQLSARANRRRR